MGGTLVYEPTLGATFVEDGRVRFRVWAPLARKVEVRIVESLDRVIPLDPAPRGYHEAVIEGVRAGARYWFLLDGERDRPDPASRFQPDGVHGSSEVVSPAFEWHDTSWHGLPIDHYIFYELHTGTFTSEGTFEAVIGHLGELAALGITAVEIMPVAQFPGSRNWGYDGAYPFAVQNSYGGPHGLKRLVDACHRHGLAVVLDVVYNHLGPEGTYIRDFGPYFTERYGTPWGPAVNLDGPGSDEVRRYFLENALRWVDEFHFDALRLDAVHEIYDHSASPFLSQLTSAVAALARRTGRAIHVIAESDRNDQRTVVPASESGLGCTAQWSDDLHHALHTMLTGESAGYYADYSGIECLAKALREGFACTGEYSPTRRRSHGGPSNRMDGRQFVVCAQNHDQIGNRMLGERLEHLTSFDARKLAAGVVLLSPYLPLLFMGEEYGEDAPFQYFVSHSDEDLIEAVRKGRREEFASFSWQGEPPDPQSEETFARCRLQRSQCAEGNHKSLYDLYRELIRLRKTHPSLALLSRKHLEVTVFAEGTAILLRRWNGKDECAAVYHFGENAVRLSPPLPEGCWNKVLYSAEPRWGGRSELPDQPGSSFELAARSFVLLSR